MCLDVCAGWQAKLLLFSRVASREPCDSLKTSETVKVSRNNTHQLWHGTEAQTSLHNSKQGVSRAAPLIHVVQTWFALLLEMDSITLINRTCLAEWKQCDWPKKKDKPHSPFSTSRLKLFSKPIQTSSWLQVHMCGRLNKVERTGICQNQNYIWLQSQSRICYWDYWTTQITTRHKTSHWQTSWRSQSMRELWQKHRSVRLWRDITVLLRLVSEERWKVIILVFLYQVSLWTTPQV